MGFTNFKQSLQNLKNSVEKWKKIENIAITEALNRILAIDIVARDDYPKHPTASMDGYAVKFDDLNQEKLKVIGTVPAGFDAKNLKIKKGECVKTFTGSLMCENSDTLIPIENVKEINGEITITKKVPKFHACRQQGESYKKDEILLKKGTMLNFSELALLAEIGIFHISVFMRPKIGVLATGSEILDLGEIPQNMAQIRSSNHIAIASMVRQFGCESVIFPIVKDDIKLLEQSIKNALSSCDILVTTGGVSVGDYDFVKQILSQNAQMIVNGAAIKPGRHIKIAKINNKFIFALPGFAYSAMVCCALYLRYAIYWSLELENDFEIEAILDESYTKKSDFCEFTACNLTTKNGEIHANLKGKKSGSSAITNNLNKNSALLVCPENKNSLKKGEVVKIIKMP